jgi:uncharacterized protein (TIGR00255 family)
MSLRSMTGYARVRKSGDAGDVTATLKTVNHRALDLHIHCPTHLEPFESAVRNIIRKSVSRGHVDVRLSYQPAHAAGSAALNRPLFEAYLNALKEARAEYNAAGEPDANNALRIPGMLSLPAPEDENTEGLEALLIEAMTEAVALLDAFRKREGEEIRRVLFEYNAAVRRDAAEVEELRKPAVDYLRKRLDERLAELLNGAPVEPQRLAQEAAILADRSDISEELNRLQVHSKELDALLEKGGEVGKKLDFLMQEMNRETNTILSKTSGIGDLGLRITALGLEIKANIERIREQALNLE